MGDFDPEGKAPETAFLLQTQSYSRTRYEKFVAELRAAVNACGDNAPAFLTWEEMKRALLGSQNITLENNDQKGVGAFHKALERKGFWECEKRANIPAFKGQLPARVKVWALKPEWRGKTQGELDAQYKLDESCRETFLGENF